MFSVYNNLEKFGIYIHVPFCRRRCIYCDFYFEIGKNTQQFHENVLLEWEARKHEAPGEPQTIYFGGGTPSLLSPAQIGALITALGPKAGEITLEANPEDLSPQYLAEIRRAGVNRLSLGVQSFEDPILKYLGRKHRSEQAKQAILDAKAAGFERISVDLIVGVASESTQSATSWLAEQKIGHLSVYLLTVENLTPLDRLIKKGRLQAPCEDAQVDAYIEMQARLPTLGYEQYEVSSYAMPGHESQHNRIYWSKGSYLGLGPGAHSMLMHADGTITRRHTHALLQDWQKKAGEASFKEERLSQNEALLEALAFGIRDMQAGIWPDGLSQKHQTKLPLGFEPLVIKLIDQGWLKQRGQCVHMTQLGARFADAVAREILSLDPGSSPG
ncbi:MAG: radical SAM family heme chaperone HemW [Myxococcota bacterium]